MIELHVDAQSTTDVILHPSAYPPATQLGDLLAIRPAQAPGRTKNKGKDRALLYKVERLSDASNDEGDGVGSARGGASQPAIDRRRPKAQVLVSSTVQQSFKWIKPRTEVVIEVLSRAGRNNKLTPPPPDEFVASHVELYFNNLYLSRPDMFRLSLALTRTCVFLNQRVTLPGSLARLRVGEIYNTTNHTARSAYVTDETKIVFRSESARCYVFVEVSQEMWQFEEDGSMLREKCEVFLDELFQHWTGRQEKGVMDAKSRGYSTSHTVSIILYGRVIYEDNGEGEEARAPMRRHENGTLYRDFFKVILDLTPSPSPSIVRTVAQEIQRWQEAVLLRTRATGEQKLAGRIAFAHESPVLEATNVALNSFEEHWIDRDLQRTGLEVIVLTAGSSYYEVPKSLLRLTTERMLYHGVGLDLISLSKTPLHTVPLFAFRSHEPGLSDEPPVALSSFIGGRRPADTHSATPSGLAYSHTTTHSTMSRPTTVAPSSIVPGTSFATTSNNTTRDGIHHETLRIALPDDQKDPLYYDSTRPAQETSVYYAEPMFVFCSFFGSQVDKPHRIDRFMPRARCYELFSQGIGERTPIAIPLLPSSIEQEDPNGDQVGFLSEWEKRQAKREKYDAMALGARDGIESLATWTRESGVTSGTTGSSVELANNAGGRWQKSAGATTGLNGSDTTESESDGGGVRSFAESARAKGAKAIAVAKQRERERERARERETELVMDKERGRQERLSDARRAAASSRSVTPMARRQRSSSAATSIRTVSSVHTKTEWVKSATPALIARLTNTIAAPSAGGSSSNASNSSRPGWLGLFRGPTTTSSAAPAPSVAVQKVEAQANVAPRFDLETDVSVTSAKPERGAPSPPPPTSRLPTPGTPQRSGPTQPISISTRAVQTRDADRPPRALRNSPSLKQFTTTGMSKGKSSGHRSIASRFNPSKPGKQSIGLADQARRWASIFIRHSNDQRSVNWVSITRGACLPLTTDYLPTADTLATQYSDYRYAVPTSLIANSFLLQTDQPKSGRSVVLELVIEMVSQRLSHGFQLVTPANHIGALDEINVASSKTISDVLHDVDVGESTAVYLTLANQIHRIWYDRRTQAVLVKIMRRRRSWVKEDYEYSGLIFTQGARAYHYSELDFPYPSMIEPGDWQHLDRLVAGAEKPDLRPSLRYWRTRLVLLPAEKVPDRDYIINRTKALDEDTSDAMINDQGFFTFRDLIETARWIPHGAEREQIPISHTALTAPEWALTVARSSNDVTFDLLSPGAHLGSQLHSPTSAAPRLSTWLSRITNTSETPPPTSPHLDRDLPLRSPSTDTTPENGSAAATPMKPVVQMSYAVILDLDPAKKSPRAERVICHLDRSHNRAAAYHLELNWLAGSGKVIDQAIQSWARQVARFGLTLVEVSTRAVEDAHNPFQSATILPFKVPPPSTKGTKLPEEYYESGLLRSLGFFLDIGADSTFPSDIDVQYSYKRTAVPHSQYIHRSGTLLIAVLGGHRGFAYVANRIYLSHLPDAKAVDDPTKKLVELCEDEGELKKLWGGLRDEADKLLEKKHGEDSAGEETTREDDRV